MRGGQEFFEFWTLRSNLIGKHQDLMEKYVIFGLEPAKSQKIRI